MEKFRVFLILYDILNYAEEKIREISKNFHIFSFTSKNKKSEIDNTEIFRKIIKTLNRKLFVSSEDIVLKNIENLNNEEIGSLINLLKIGTNNFFLLFKEEKKLETIKNELTKNKIGYRFFDVRIKGYLSAKKIIESELKNLKLKNYKEFLNVLLENYKNDIETFFQDIKKANLYFEKEDNLNWEDLKNFFQSTTDEFKIQESFFSLNFPLFLSRFKKYINSLNSLPYQERKNKVNFIIYNLLFGALVKIYIMKVNPNIKIEGHPFYISKLKEFSSKIDIQTIKNLIKTLAIVDKKINKIYLNYKDIPEEIVINYFLLQKPY